MDIESSVHIEIRKLIESGFCDDYKQGRVVSWCASYGKNGCPRTCSYAKKMDQKLQSGDLLK